MVPIFMHGQLNHLNLYNQPGYYNHIQMRALRDEYTKLPGIRFAWVMGKTAVQVSSIIKVNCCKSLFFMETSDLTKHFSSFFF